MRANTGYATAGVLRQSLNELCPYSGVNTSGTVVVCRYLLFIGGSDDVPVGLGVVGDALAAEVLGQLVDELTLLPVHARERVRTGLLLRL